MEKETGSPNREEPFEIDWSAHAAEGGNEDEKPESTRPAAADADLPVEPTPPWEQDAAGYDAGAVHAELLDFFLYGRRGPRAVPGAGENRPLPALLYPYRDVAAVRHDYPVCLVDDGVVRPLTAIIDDLLERVGEEGEVGERRARHVLQLEAAMRRACTEPAQLTAVWDTAATSLLDSVAGDDKRELLRQSLSRARDALELDGELLPCAAGTPRRLFLAVVATAWDRKCAAWRDELESLVARAHNILAADESHSADKHSPEHLRDSVAGEDLDFEAMSGLLKNSHVGEPLPEARRSRIARALDTITRVKPLFDGSATLLDRSAKLPFDLQPVRNVCKAARDRHAERMRVMVDFFKSIRIIELEVDNRYREKAHDRFFAQFEAAHLTAEELSYCPPVVVLLDGDFFESPDVAGLLDLLASGLPVRVFAEVDDLAGPGSEGGNPASIPGWSAKLARMVAAIDGVHVTQASASLPMLVVGAATDGFEHDNSSLTVVYTGDVETHPGLARYLATASAVESRLFPAFVFDPGKGDTLAERMSVEGNPSVEREWPGDTFASRTEGGDERTAELEFTAADFVYTDIRFEGHFWCVPAEKWHEKMTPLHEYLRLQATDIEDRVPYITAVDNDAVVTRVIVTHHVVDMVRRVASAWHSTQESGGVDNSFARLAVEREKDRLADEKAQEIAEIEKKYAADLDRDLGDLTQEIVQRIAAQLLSQGLDAGAAFVAPATAPKPAKPAQPVEAPAQGEAEPAVEEEDEDEIVVSADPYIDTPLCTSCNECTKLNNRLFAYDDNKQAYIADADAGTFRDLVVAAEKCPVKIIHPGKPRDPSEQGLDELVKRAEPFN